MSENRKAYLTKYALTGGVRVEAITEERTWEDGSVWLTLACNRWDSFKVGRDVFHSEDEARADFEARKAKKIAALKKQIAKLEKLTFSVKEAS